MRRWLLVISVLIIAGISSIGASECNDVKEKKNDQYERAERIRIDTFEKAEKLYPTPKNENFPLREALVEYTKRQDLKNHPWYIYVVGDNGNYIGYFTSKTYPQSVCNFLSRTAGDLPSLDGIYYGGGGSQSTCDDKFFFDNATSAMIVLNGLNSFALDVPLALDVKPIPIRANLATP